MVMAPQPLRALRPSAPAAGHAACRCSAAAPLFGKRAPLVVAFPRAGGGGGAVVVSCSAVQESSTSTTGTVLLATTLPNRGATPVLN